MDVEKEKEEVRARDLSPAMVERFLTPKKTWFFERIGDGFVFACEEREAFDICYNKSRWKRRDFRLLGTSDGLTFDRVRKESMGRARELEPEIERLKTEIQKYQDAEEKLIMDEVVDMEGDPADVVNEANKQKVLRIRAILDRIHDQLDTLEDEYKNVTANVIRRATEAELEVAKANQAERIKNGLGLDWPSEDLNGFTPDADPRTRKKILNIMNGRMG